MISIIMGEESPKRTSLFTNEVYSTESGLQLNELLAKEVPWIHQTTQVIPKIYRSLSTN